MGVGCSVHHDPCCGGHGVDGLQPPPEYEPKNKAEATHELEEPYPSVSRNDPAPPEAPSAPSAPPEAKSGYEDQRQRAAEADLELVARGSSNRRPTLEECLPLLLDEDKAVFEFDARRREVALRALPELRERVPGCVDKVPAEALEDAARFCSDETLLRYLCTCDSNVDKAAAMLKATVEWRGPFFRSASLPSPKDVGRPSRTLCPHCTADPSQHCFFRIGTDSVGREVIYACAGRASNKVCNDGMLHMALELERIFEGNSARGQVVWIVDFAGFGLVDCHPRAGLAAVPLFANHYSERMAQIVLLSFPAVISGMYHVLMKLVDPVTRRRVLILNSDASRNRYMEKYWSGDPAMLEWMRAVQRCKGAPGSFPSIELGRRLGDAATVEMLERCSARAHGRANL